MTIINFYLSVYQRSRKNIDKKRNDKTKKDKLKTRINQKEKKKHTQPQKDEIKRDRDDTDHKLNTTDDDPPFGLAVETSRIVQKLVTLASASFGVDADGRGRFCLFRFVYFLFLRLLKTVLFVYFQLFWHLNVFSVCSFLKIFLVNFFPSV